MILDAICSIRFGFEIGRFLNTHINHMGLFDLNSWPGSGMLVFFPQTPSALEVKALLDIQSMLAIA